MPKPLLVLEGDSWFNLPGGSAHDPEEKRFGPPGFARPNDFGERLKSRGYEVKSVAEPGDRLSEMLEKKQLAKLRAELQEQAEKGRKPAAILLSAGGHDMRDRLDQMLNEYKAESGFSPVNDSEVAAALDEIAGNYGKMFRTLDEIVGRFYSAPLAIPVLAHGYSYHVPDGRNRGDLAGIGPWLGPVVGKKGYPDLPYKAEAIAQLVDGFNKRLKQCVKPNGKLSSIAPHYVNFRFPARSRLAQYVSSGAYGNDWVDEVHLTPHKLTYIVDKRLIARVFPKLGVPIP